MGRMYAFHSTARGHLHIAKGTPCEDSSASFRAEDGRYFIAAVADGHGADACFRSREGSGIAVKTAIENLRQFAEATLTSEEVENRFYLDLFSNPRYRRMTMKRLTDTIVAQWNDRVLEHFQANPPTAQEQEKTVKEKAPSHIYGTTLIAALRLPRCLLLFQQGDGRCEVFFADGTVEQPIPWDDRCEFSTTTSLCDQDAAESFRSHAIDLARQPVMACLMGSDGVEDAYRDTYSALGGTHVLMGGVHAFYKDLLCQLAAMEPEKFEAYLETMLPDFSEKGRFSNAGSGDDVSVAGIVELDCIPQYVEAFQKYVTRYALEESLFWQEDALRGKTRKREILRRRVGEAEARKAAEEEEKGKLDATLRQKREALRQKEQRLAERKDSRDQLGEELQMLRQAICAYSFKRLLAVVSKALDWAADCYRRVVKNYEREEESVRNFARQIDALEKELEERERTVQSLEDKCRDAQQEYLDYNQAYEAIEKERDRIRQEITALDSEQLPETLPSDGVLTD